MTTKRKYFTRPEPAEIISESNLLEEREKSNSSPLLVSYFAQVWGQKGWRVRSTCEAHSPRAQSHEKTEN
jgi:hypothetical protein